MRSTGEKVIAIVGLGLALAVLAGTVSWLVVSAIFDNSGGWFAYAPEAEPTLPDLGSDRAWAALWAALIWLGAIGAWVAIALGIWRDPQGPQEGDARGFLQRMRDRDD